MKNTEGIRMMLYLTRHLESTQNDKGFGEVNCELTEKGKKNAAINRQLVNAIGVKNIDWVISGDYIKHKETTRGILEGTGYDGPIVFDSRLVSIPAGPILEDSPEKVEKDYNLGIFNPEAGFERIKMEDGRIITYEGNLCNVEIPDFGVVSFDPKEEGVFPFNQYFRGYIDEGVKRAVFPHDTQTFPSFDKVRDDVKNFHEELVEKVRENDKPLAVLGVGSMSINALVFEYALRQTVAENARGKFNGMPIYPQGHNDVMVMGYTQEDLVECRNHLRPITCNVPIDKYVKEHFK